jgi:GNAT superfamily N-acetyltransferase
VIRRATADDAAAAAELLDRFNREYDEPSPGPDALAARLRELLAAGDSAVLLAGAADGVAVLRFRPSLWTAGLECYLAELYVVPALRGQGRGRALMEAALELARKRGADWMELNTDEGDVAARALYERLGFKATADYYEREL